MLIQNKIQGLLKHHHVDFIHFVDISNLNSSQTQGYTCAVLFGKALSPSYLKKVASTPNYVALIKENKTIESDEFHNTEIATDKLADELALFIQQSGYNAYSQSEKNIEQTGHYNLEQHRTPLPHKTIALLAGLGWIGKNNLLITPDYGCAISMCSVLTNAPLECSNQLPQEPACDNCSICQNICQPHAILGRNWSFSTHRDDIINVNQCCTCFMCVVKCPYSVKYYNKSLI
ncbi:MAG: epoxyqueuosine reductase [Bacteroidales bacterium]|nr:epoxyqueuosine reductase [Bacteroidales bacterium]